MRGMCLVQFVGGILLLLIVLSNLSLSFGQTPPVCGRPQVPPSKGVRIVGGGLAANNSWPWACALVEEVYRAKEKVMTYRQFCDCTLIDKDYVVTAAHCTYFTPNSRMSKIQFKYYVKVYLGEENLVTAKNNPARKYSVLDVLPHSQYIDSIKHNDISLIRLARSVDKFDNDLMPACLPFRPVTEGPFIQKGMYGRRLAYLGGWGHTYEGQGKAGIVGSGTDKLRQTSAEIYSNAECQRKAKITSTMFCAGYDSGGRDTCQGDSGGPLMVEEESGVWVLHGIVSWGAGCARANSPGVYTNVYVFRDWLMQTTGVKFPIPELPATTPPPPPPAGRR